MMGEMTACDKTSKVSQTLEVSNAFKETEIGPIPVEWDVVPLGELGTQFFSGGTPSTKKAEFWDGDIPWTTSAYITDDLYLGRGAKYITTQGLEKSSAKLVPEGNLLIGTRVGVGKAAVNLIDVAISQDLTGVVVDKDKVHLEFLAYAIRLDSIQELIQSFTRGTTIKGIPRKDLIQVPIPLPPLPEQRRIAHVLNAIQREIAAQDDLITAARELKRSLMQRLFTYGPGTDPAPTKETEFGDVPEHWDVVRLGDVATIGNGSTPKRTTRTYWEGGTIPWLTSGKVHERIIQKADEFVTELAQEECHLPLVRKGSIVVAITGQGKTLGNAALVTFDTCINQHLAYAQFRVPHVVPEFVLAFLQQQYEDLRQASRAGGSTKGALTCGFLTNYLLPLPSTEEQREIAFNISAVDRKIAAEQDRKTALQALFKSTLHQLMTGQIRLKDVEL
jgi:type I restriction enzyme S subunit